MGAEVTARGRDVNRPVRVYCHPSDVRRVRVLLDMAGVRHEVHPSPAAHPGRPYLAPNGDR